jgi:hypothetical protein
LVVGDLTPVQQFMKARGKFDAKEAPAPASKPNAGKGGNAPGGGMPGMPAMPGGGGAPGGGNPAAPPAKPMAAEGIPPAEAHQAPGGGMPGMPGGGGGMPGMPGGGGGPGPGGGGAAKEPAPTSNAYLTISPRLKAMLDRVEAQPTVLASMVCDLGAADGWFLDIGAGLQPPPHLLGLAIQITKDQLTYLLSTDNTTEENAKLLHKYLKEVMTLVITWMQGLGIKVELVSNQQGGGGGMAGMPGGGGMPGMPGGGAGMPGMPGGGGGGMPGMPGGGGMPGMPGGGGMPGMPGGAPGGQQPKPGEPPPPSIKVRLTQHAKLVDLGIEVNGLATGRLAQALEPYWHLWKNEMEMALARPKQQDLAVALRGYVTDPRAASTFPRGTYEPHTNPARYKLLSPRDRTSWMASLLPMLGHNEEFGLINIDKSWKDPDNRRAATTVIPQFLDGSSPRERWRVKYPGVKRHLPALIRSRGEDEEDEFAATHFVGIAGVGLDAAMWLGNEPGVQSKLGVFGYDRQTRLEDILDGVSNTVMVVEVPWDKVGFPQTAHPRPWIAGGGATVQGVPEKKSIEPFVSMMYDGKRGTFVLMADGSVRFVSDKIADDVFKAMCTIRGGEKLNVDRDAPLLTPAAGPEMVAKPGLPPVLPKEEPKKEAAPPPTAKPPAAGPAK